MLGNAFFDEDVQRIAEIVRAFADPARSPSAGEVTRSDILAYANVPARDGVGAERIFGPLEAFCCRCKAVSGEPHAGVVCERCGVLCGDPAERTRRWGHITLASPCLIPAFAPLAAELLAVSVEDVLALARHEAWWHDGALFAPPGSTRARTPGVPIWEWEPPGVGELDPASRELYRVNAQLRRLGALPDWAKEHFGDEAAWYDEALAGCGHAGLRAALAAVPSDRAAAFEARVGLAPVELLVGIVPVPPPAQRPFEIRAGFRYPGTLDRALARIVAISGQVAHVLAHGTFGAIEVRGAERWLQLTFEESWHRASGHLPGWLVPPVLERIPDLAEPAPHAPSYDEPALDTIRRVSSLALAGEVALVGLPTATIPLRLGDASIGAPVRTAGLALLHCDPDGSHAVLMPRSADQVHVLDLATRRWLVERPAFLGYALHRVTETETQLVDHRSLRATSLTFDLVISACGRFYLERIDGLHSIYGADGNVVRTLDGEAVTEAGYDDDVPMTWLHEDGELRVFDDAGEAEEQRPACPADARAFVVGETGELLTVLDGVLARNRAAVCGFAFPVDAAAFDPLGRRLLVASQRALTLLDVRQAPRIIAQWSITPLLDQMAPAGCRCSPRALAAVLQQYGTLSEVAGHTATELLAVTMLDESWEQVAIGADEARRIARMARNVAAPSQLASLR